MAFPVVRSFAGGEVTPEMFGRFDLSKQQTGLALCRNFTIEPHGVAKNRAGFEYVNHVKFQDKRTRVIEFSYNSEQTYAIELGEGYARFHTGGSTLVEPGVAITGVTQAVPGEISAPGHTFVNGQWVFLSGFAGGMTELNGRFVKVINAVAGVSFRINDLHDVAIDTTGYAAYSAGGVAARVVEITTPYLEGDLFAINFTQSNDVLTLVHPAHPPAEIRRTSPSTWTYTVINFIPTIATPAAGTAVGVIGPNGNPAPALIHFYRVTAVATETEEESLPSPAFQSNIAINLGIAGNSVQITVPVVAGAERMNVYKLRNGIYAFIAQTIPGGVVEDNNIAPDASKTVPIAQNPFVGVGNFPGAVGYHENRRIFAGTDSRPQSYWMTVSGTESNLSYSIPSRADDSITGRIVAKQANRIRHVASLSQLVMLTSGGEWKFNPTGNTAILTPDSAFPKQDAQEGAATVKTAFPGSAVVYVDEAGSKLRSMSYKWQSNGWSVDDLTIMAPHLFDGFQTLDLGFQKNPYKTIWAVRDDGVLLGCTYHPEHEVQAWHQHNTQGQFESVAAIKEGGDYPAYVVAKRFVNGRDVRYIERQRSRRFTDQADAFFVDAGATYDGPAVNTITGLWHLIGADVSVLADGSVFTGFTVSATGTITFPLGTTVEKVHIGLGYNAELQTVPLAMEGLPAFATAGMKNASSTYLRVDRTQGLEAGPSFDKLRPFPPRSTEVWGSPPSLKSTVIEIPMTPHWTINGQVCVRQAQPLPATILGIVTEYETEYHQQG